MRFKVSTCEGYLTNRVGHYSSGPGLSAYVLDTLNCHRVVGRFRSETRLHQRGERGLWIEGETQGRDVAIKNAERLAGFLNAHDA